jgi:hypothetical protein
VLSVLLVAAKKFRSTALLNNPVFCTSSILCKLNKNIKPERRGVFMKEWKWMTINEFHKVLEGLDK